MGNFGGGGVCDGNILYLDWGGGYMIVCICKNSKPAHLRRVNVTVFKLYLNKFDFTNVWIPTSAST